MNTIRTAFATVLSLAALSVQAQHAVTVNWFSPSNDATTLTLTNNGPADIVAFELFAGPQLKNRAIFNTSGTQGDLTFPHWADTRHFSTLTSSTSLQTGEHQSWPINVDQIYLGDIPFLAEARDLNAYVGLRIIPVWEDGFETYIPMSHSPFATDTSYTFTDITVVPAVPEPESLALLLAGLSVVSLVSRKKAGV
jgi:hypothetical protein